LDSGVQKIGKGGGCENFPVEAAIGEKKVKEPWRLAGAPFGSLALLPTFRPTSGDKHRAWPMSNRVKMSHS
jgi:hypothetical protein